MADTKISALTAATTPLAGTEVLPIVQSGVTKQVSVANLTAGRAISADSLTLTGSPLPATSGGTGQSSYAVGDLLYASTTTALSKLADVATGNALISGGVGVAPSWGKIDLTTHISGTLAVGNGGTGNTTGAATAVISNATTGVMQIVGPGAGTTRVMTIPNANFTAARTDAAQTFTGDQTFNNNIGIAAAPSGWSSLFSVLELSGNGAVMGVSGLNLFNNAYYNGSDYVYKTTAAATRLLNSGGEWYWYRAASGTAGTAITFGSPKMTLDASDNLSVPGIYANTTASAANVYVDSAGKLYRSTSAMKYKQDIRDLEEIDTSLLRPVRYKSKCDGDDQSKDHFGIVADEAAEKGFEELVLRGANGEIEGFQYERLSVVLLKKLQILETKINSILTR